MNLKKKNQSKLVTPEIYFLAYEVNQTKNFNQSLKNIHKISDEVEVGKSTWLIVLDKTNLEVNNYRRVEKDKNKMEDY